MNVRPFEFQNLTEEFSQQYGNDHNKTSSFNTNGYKIELDS